MGKAIGLVEYKTVAAGVSAADLMIKTAEVSVLEAHPVCPGKYIVLISGDLSAVRAAVDAAKSRYTVHLIDSFVLGNPDESIFAAIYGAAEISDARALGVVETFSVASAIVAADAAAKTADVELVELRLARGLCGKSYAMLTGDVSAVTAAVQRAEAEAGRMGMFLDSSVIANPDKRLWETIL